MRSCPQLLPADALAQANSLDQLIRPLALRLAGPALGGVARGRARRRLDVRARCRLVRDLGRGAAGDVPGRPAGVGRRGRRAESGDRGEIRAGLRYVRSHAWLWATLVTAAIAYLLFMGPTEVLLPFIVKHRFADGARDLGLIFAAGGLGSLGVRGRDRRSSASPAPRLTFMYLTWTVATVAVAGYGLSSGLWGLMLASVAVQHAGDRRHDRLGDRQAAPRPARSCSAGCRASTG